jgi:hypothetical protein
MLKKIKSLKLKKKEYRSGKVLIQNSRTTLDKPNIPLKFFSKVHKIIHYDEKISEVY